MKNNILKKLCSNFLIAILAVSFFASCNKDLPVATPITAVENSLTLNDFLTKDTAFTFLNALAAKATPATLASLGINFSDITSTYTFFAPNNNAFRAAGITSTTAVGGAFTASQAASIISYLLVPGLRLTFADFSTSFPNLQMPTALSIGILPLPGTTNFPFKATIFPSKRGSTVWVNNVPATSFDNHFQNGVVHTLAGLVTPPSLVLAQIVYGDPNLSLFSAMIARGDQAQPVPSLKVDAIMQNPGANLSLFAPTNAAVKAFINAASGGAVPLGAPDATFVGFINNNLPAQSAQGIVLYHFMGVRAFSVNFPASPALFPTLLNSGVPSHPGVSVQSVFASSGLSVTSIRASGVANGGATAVSSPPTNFDKNGVNGVVHVIDRVLLPF